MLLFSSISLVFLISILVVYCTYRKRRKLTSMTGMIVSMTNSMMSSAALGTMLGIFITDKDVTFPTIAAVTAGMMAGYLTGRPVSLMASLDGITAGIMGGMMGAMLGVMVQPAHATIMICFIDMIYLVVNVLLLRVILEETKEPLFKKTSFLIKCLNFLVLLVFMGILISLNIHLLSR